MMTKEQMAILDDLEAVCKKLTETEKGMRILANYRNGGWFEWQQVGLISDGLVALGMMSKDLRPSPDMDDHDFCQEFQDHEALYLIGAGYIARGMGDVTEGLVDDMKHDSNLVKESHRPLRKRSLKENRMSPRFTKLLKEAYGRLDTDYSKLVFKCVEVTVNDKRYTASCKEGDVLDFDGLVDLAKDYEPINGNVVFDVRTNQDTAEECLILSLSTSDVSGTEEVENDYEYEEGEELLVAEYWFTVRVEDNDSLKDIGDEVIKQCYGD